MAGCGRGVVCRPEHCVQAHCELKTMEVEISTSPWHCIVCVCSHTDQQVLYLTFTLQLVGTCCERRPLLLPVDQ